MSDEQTYMPPSRLSSSARFDPLPNQHTIQLAELELLEDYFSNNSEVYCQLNKAKCSGWNSESLDGVFNKFKFKLPMNIQQKDNKEMAAIMKAVLLEVDAQSGFPIRDSCSTFLDLCCAPGGFTDYILSASKEAIGMGVTMPYRDGGHSMQVPNSKRFWCYYKNVIDDATSILFCKPFHKMPFIPPAYSTIASHSSQRNCSPIMNACDVVLLDGHYLTPPDKLKAYAQSFKVQTKRPSTSSLMEPIQDTQMGEMAFNVFPIKFLPPTPLPRLEVKSTELRRDDEKKDFKSIYKNIYKNILPSGQFPSWLLDSSPRAKEMAFETIRTQNALWISQIIIAIRNLREGGTLIMRGTTKPDLFLQALLCLIARVFKGQLRPIKPTVSHMMRSQFYVVCRGFDLQLSRQINLLSILQGALQNVKNSIAIDEIMWPNLQGLQDFQSRSAFIQAWGPSLQTFLEPLWKFQQLALAAMVDNGDTGRLGGKKDKMKVCYKNVLNTCSRDPQQCWYAHQVEELLPALQEACSIRFMPLVPPWQPSLKNQEVGVGTYRLCSGFKD